MGYALLKSSDIMVLVSLCLRSLCLRFFVLAGLRRRRILISILISAKTSHARPHARTQPRDSSSHKRCILTRILIHILIHNNTSSTSPFLRNCHMTCHMTYAQPQPATTRHHYQRVMKARLRDDWTWQENLYINGRGTCS